MMYFLLYYLGSASAHGEDSGPLVLVFGARNLTPLKVQRLGAFRLAFAIGPKYGRGSGVQDF